LSGFWFRNGLCFYRCWSILDKRIILKSGCCLYEHRRKLMFNNNTQKKIIKMNKNKSNKVKMNKFKILELPFWYDNELRSKYWSSQKEIDAENTKDAKVTLKSIVKSDPSAGKVFSFVMYLYQNVADSAKWHIKADCQLRIMHWPQLYYLDSRSWQWNAVLPKPIWRSNKRNEKKKIWGVCVQQELTYELYKPDSKTY
jgi:hypothetical protein